jgi:transposase-like protein
LETSEDTASNEAHLSSIKHRIISPACAVRMVTAGFCDGYGITARVLDMLQGCSAHCPECGQFLDSIKQADRYYLLQRITCPKCKKQAKATKGTILHNAAITPEDLFIIALLTACDKPATDIADRIGKSPDTVRIWRKNMEDLRPAYE